MSDRPSALLRIGFLSPHNPYDRRAFSGTAFYAAEALAAHPRVTLSVLGGHRRPGLTDRWLRRASDKLTAFNQDAMDGLDAVVGLVASTLIDGLKPTPGCPVLHVTDATPHFLRDTYGWNIPPEIDAREARVIDRADRVIYSSREMAAEGARDFNTAATSAPFGINLDAGALPRTCPEKPVLYRPQLLFVGNDWARKGGDLAVATLDALRARGVDAHLTVVGRIPTALAEKPHVTAMGYLNKNKPADAATLARLYARSHLLLVPSRADCTPMVAAEAMAHGTPVLASDTGGIATLIGGPGHGRLLPLAADATDWADAAQTLIAEPMAYYMVSDACFDHARARLSWTAWTSDILDEIDALRRDRGATDQTRLREIAA